jgi:hypothetical protein
MENENYLVFDLKKNNTEAFKEYVKNLEVAQDLEFDIKRTEETKNNQLIINRDANNSNKNPNEQEQLNADIQAKIIITTTRARAAIKMLEIEDKINPNNKINNEENRNKIITEYENCIKELKPFLNKNDANFSEDSKSAFQAIKKFDLKIGDIFQENKIDKMNKKFTEMVFWESSVFDSIPLQTEGKIKINGKTYKTLTIDEPIKPFLSGKRIKSFQDDSYRDEEWYKNLTEFQKINFEEHKEDIISGKHVLPHKFNFIPGLRNAFKRTDSIIDENGKEIASSTILHMSNPASIGAGKDSEKLTTENLNYTST